jgi:gluconate 2-dehydrogenase gamma chain
MGELKMSDKSDVPSVSRRDIVKSLAMGAAASSVLRAIPLQAAEYAHRLIESEKASEAGAYTPKFFNPHQFQTLRTLCQTIIPPDEHGAGAIEAGGPEFIDLLTSENNDYQLMLGGGLVWLDSTCADRYGKTYLESVPAQQTEILDLIAYRRNGELDESLSQGVAFFALLRNLTVDAYFTSEIGINDLQYIGNVFMKDFPGCPPLPEP